MTAAEIATVVPMTRNWSDRCQRELILTDTERCILSAERSARLILLGIRRRTRRRMPQGE
jgi:hypothetical protein